MANRAALKMANDFVADFIWLVYAGAAFIGGLGSQYANAGRVATSSLPGGVVECSGGGGDVAN